MQKKIPMRQCLGCRVMKPKRELIRVVRSPDGVITLDFKGKNPGRGAYVCRDADCLKRAIKSRALERARWLLGSIPDGVFTEYDDGMDRASWDQYLSVVRSSELFRDVFTGAP